ncbi:MAG: hypothetical protein CMG66_05810 [Candidatus Marinimicrobia bacterium]|nr:hypothetical protein [Candidatus Neomarinimicrobiota bacterium]|tara:strand:+ start:39359 stop:41104 length:1746 start_codon:yes stop_codon:yes gene_type:complete
MFKKLLFLFIFTIALSEDFSDGPYGYQYFDIAGPFSLPDLNLELYGDANIDGIINIQDVILLVGNILGNNSFTEDQSTQADANSDGIIDILDIVEVVNGILNAEDPLWIFQDEWTGNDSYIFINYEPSASYSTALWGSNTKDQLLEISPSNAHYFFISNRSQYASDIEYLKSTFDEILMDLSEEEQNHWKNHLHFINARASELDNWLSDALPGKKALSIDCFQRIREVGYLGNPANFTGTYIHYLAHEALYFNYERNVFNNSNQSSYDEIVIFDETVYTGGWAATLPTVVELPSNDILDSYSKLEVELLRGCPDVDGNYSDDGCDDYDRQAHLYLCDEDGSNCLEIARWITPFDRQPHHLTDITPFISSLRPGGNKTFKFQESGWPNSLITLKLRLHHGTLEQDSPKEIYPIWNGTVQFNPSYSDNRPPQVFAVPENATKVEFVAYITGHGWGAAGCFNCCEFCNSRHIFEVNGGVYTFNKDFPTAGGSTYCMQPETIVQGVIPNQGGTWGYGRAGWCPGMDVHPYIIDITDYIIVGEDNIIDYSACRVSGNNCVTPPTCAGNSGEYCPEMAFSSYIVISY